MILLISASCLITWDNRCPPPHLLVENGVFPTFYPGWPQTAISASQIFRIAGVCHWLLAVIYLLFFFSLCFIRIYLLYGGSSLWQFQISLDLNYTLVRSPPLCLPLNPLPAPLKAITRSFFVLFHISIWSPSIIFPHLNLLHWPSFLPQEPPTLYLFYSSVFFINS
jgi:hypothetical protein